jgi:hypothetical protein
MVKKLLMLSDINGLFLLGKPGVTDYAGSVNVDEIMELDSMVLAGLGNERDVDTRHEKLVAGGIDVAASALFANYPTGVEVALGLSVSGTILWRAALKGLPIKKLICFSSTRLRFESQAPACDIRLYFGDADLDRPSSEWFKSLGQIPRIIPGHGHEFYRTDIELKLLHEEIS